MTTTTIKSKNLRKYCSMSFLDFYHVYTQLYYFFLKQNIYLCLAQWLTEWPIVIKSPFAQFITDLIFTLNKINHNNVIFQDIQRYQASDPNKIPRKPFDYEIIDNSELKKRRKKKRLAKKLAKELLDERKKLEDMKVVKKKKKKKKQKQHKMLTFIKSGVKDKENSDLSSSKESGRTKPVDIIVHIKMNDWFLIP